MKASKCKSKQDNRKTLPFADQLQTENKSVIRNRQAGQKGKAQVHKESFALCPQWSHTPCPISTA